MKAELVFIGTELLLGETLNANAQYIGRRLADLGVDVFYHVTVGDNLERIKFVLQQAGRRADIVICTGGLGPTQDDLTRDAIAAVTGRNLTIDENLKLMLAGQLAKRGVEATNNQFRQAQLPLGAEALSNPFGTAPGVWLDDGKRVWVALPGPPREMQAMFEAELVPRLLSLTGEARPTRLFRRVLKIAGLPEAVVEDRLQDLIRAQTDPTIAPYAHAGEIHLRLATKAGDEETAAARWQPLEQEIRRRLGWHLYGVDEETLAGAVGKKLLARRWRLATAESCTGGLLGARLTDQPGSSAYFVGSVVAYDNALKQRLLTVSSTVLRDHGAVSEQVAMAMARGARQVADVEVGVGVTGIAGPGGGTEAKPVGTVFVALASPVGCTTRQLNLGGARTDVRERTVTRALALMLEHLSQ